MSAEEELQHDPAYVGDEFHGDDFAAGDEPFDLHFPLCSKSWEVELPECITSMSLSPKGTLLIATTVDDEILILDTATGETKFTLAGHKGGTNKAAFVTGVIVASCGEDGRLKIWNVAHQTCVAEVVIDGVDADRSPYGHSVNGLSLSPDGKMIVVCSGKSVIGCSIRDGPSAPKVKVYPPLPSTVEMVRCDTNGNMLASYNGGVTLWDMSRSEADLQAIDLPYDVSRSIFRLPNSIGFLYFICMYRSSYKTFKYLKCTDLMRIIFMFLQGACLSVDIDQKSEWLVTGCHDASLHIFHLAPSEDGQGVHLSELTCGGYDGKVKHSDFAPNGSPLMASSGGTSCTVWDFSSSPAGSIPTVTVGHTGGITCQAWQQDGPYLLTGGKDGRVLAYHVVRDAEPGTPNLCPPAAEAAHEDGSADGDEVTALQVGRNGVVFVGHVSGVVRRWELPPEEKEDVGVGAAAAGFSEQL